MLALYRAISLMDVVAEKTGYPADALDLSMSLEGDLKLFHQTRRDSQCGSRESTELPEVDVHDGTVANTR